MSVIRVMAAVFHRDLALAWRAGGGAAMPVAFLLGSSTLLPLAIGSDQALLARVGAPVVWLAMALSMLTVLERLFQADLEDGTIDLFAGSPAPMTLLTAAKGAALWVANGLPLALAGGVAAIALQTPPAAVPALMASLAVGAGAFVGLGLIGAALAAGTQRGGLLIALIVLPLYAPTIIFGAAVADRAVSGEAFAGPFAFLAATTLAAITLGPPFAAAALKVHLD
jgi:heme exporter protein B